jgi:acyl-CoA synthetase (AMP-forming)/AMP-acid ligase II
MINGAIEYYARLTPNAIAAKDNNNEVTYAELNDNASIFSSYLAVKNVTKGDRIIILGSNCIEFIVAMYGCLKAGVIFIPLNDATTINRREYIKKNSNAKTIITPTIVNEALSSYAELPKPHHVNISDDDIAFIIYTSGTTGYPKGVIEPHGSVLFAVSSINNVLENNSDDKLLCGLPLSFDYGLYQVFLAFDVGATLILIQNLNHTLSLPKILHENNITGFPLVPSVASALVNSRLLERISLPSLRYITSTGDSFHTDYIDKLLRINSNISIFPMYGLTECKRVSILTPRDYPKHKNSVGKPIPGTFTYLIDSNGSKVKDNQSGVLVVCGKHVMSGYWEDKDETDKRFFIDKESGCRALITNDIFSIDSYGYLYYIGRDDSIIKSNGYRIGVTEVEHVILQLPNVIEVCAFGENAGAKGQSVALHIYNQKRELTIEQVKECFYDYFSDDVVLGRVVFHQEALKKTVNGKLDRRFYSEPELS